VDLYSFKVIGVMNVGPNIDDDIFEGLIELKYIARNKFSQNKLEKQITQAKKQLSQYNPQEFEIGIVVVFSGWEMVYCEKLKVR
jgi:hypothetical protein